MAVWLYGDESCALKKKDRRKSQFSDTTFFKAVKHKMLAYRIRQTVNIFNLEIKFIEYKVNWCCKDCNSIVSPWVKDQHTLYASEYIRVFCTLYIRVQRSYVLMDVPSTDCFWNRRWRWRRWWWLWQAYENVHIFIFEIKAA